MINKVKDIMTDISSDNINLGDIGVKFYTEDKNTVAIRIFINKGKNRIDLEKFDYTVRLDLFHSDGSIWIDEPVRIVNPSIGLIQYNIPDNIIKHHGKIEAKLFFKKDTNSMHVLNFNFNIIDSGINDAIEKEISVNLVDDSVRRIIQENAIELLGDGFKDEVSVELQNYVSTNNELFKGPKGDKGDEGKQGQRGPQGLKGDTGEQGIQGPKGEKGTDGLNGARGPKGDKGDTGAMGPQGPAGKDGVNGTDAFIVVSREEPEEGNIWFEVTE